MGLVPKNYLVELSQYLTSEVDGGRAKTGGGSSQQASHPLINRSELDARPWFFGMIGRADCDRMLSETGDDGDFLIRESETNV